MSLQFEPIPSKRIRPLGAKKVVPRAICLPDDQADDANGAKATLKLADEYKNAAELLYAAVPKKNPRSLAPWRLLAIHAIELYLNAYLVSKGSNQNTFKSIPHNFGRLAKMALDAKLVLKKKTAEHLTSMTTKREYVVVRYGPGTKDENSELNRLTATLDEVSSKVARAIPA